MHAIAVILGLVGIAVAIANTLTVRALWASDQFERFQKITQTVLVWILPGSFLAVRHILREPKRQAVSDDLTARSTRDRDQAWDYVPHDGHDGGHH
jgi:hypothetical protein